MTLYELLGLIAVGGGLGFSVGIAGPNGTVSWFSLAAGALIGIAAFLMFRRVTQRVDTERSLALMYGATFVGTFAATTVGAWLIRASMA